MRTYKLVAGYNASANALASIQVLRSGRLRSLRWAIGVNTILDNSEVVVELSFSNVSQIATSNTIGVVDEVRWFGNFVTSGLSAGSINIQRMLDMPVNAGELLYLNAYVVTAAGTFTVFLDIEER